MNAIAEHQEFDSLPATGLMGLAERGLLPDALIRAGIRAMCAQRLREERGHDLAAESARFQQRIMELRGSPLAMHVGAANRQHYEVPTGFFELCLGRRLKYSCALYATGEESLDEAEDAMLELYATRAQLADGQRILELGCGWGSLTLWMAQRYPGASITAVSNSHSQRAHILARCARLGLHNVEVFTADINHLKLDERRFDRCVSVEMFEHLRNYAQLMQRISGWLEPGGKLFVHIFAHRSLMYPFEAEGRGNWMGRHFFTGGLMPSADTLLYFQEHLGLRERWLLDGTHYERTANHWLQNQDRQRSAVMSVLRECYGDGAAALWFQRWRLFWMACAELFGYRDGQEWLVAHYLFERR